MSKRCYLSGPMRGIDEYNYPEFNRVAATLRSAGWTVFNPAEMDADADTENYAKHSLEQQEEADTAENVRRFARRDLEVLLSLRPENGDVVFVLPGADDSAGAQAEIAVARWLKLVVTAVDPDSAPTSMSV